MTREQRLARLRRVLVGLTICASFVFLLIGLRFLIAPEDAASTFGLGPKVQHELHRVVGLRDLWLAVLALALALLGEWRALALWFLMGSFVCFADGAIVLASSANPWAVAFHVGAGVFFFALAWASRRAATLTSDQRNGLN